MAVEAAIQQSVSLLLQDHIRQLRYRMHRWAPCPSTIKASVRKSTLSQENRCRGCTNLNLVICMGLGPHSILNKLIPFTWQIQSERRHLLIIGPTAAALGAALTPPLVILLKLSCFYLHSGCVHPVLFLLAFCKGCELHPGSFGAVSVPCDYILWGRQKLWMSYNSKHTAVHFFFPFCFCCNSQEQIAQIRNRHWTVALQLFKKNTKHLQENNIFWQCSLSMVFSTHIFTAVSAIITAWKSFISPKILNASIFQKYESQKLFWFYFSLYFHWEDLSGRW